MATNRPEPDPIPKENSDSFNRVRISEKRPSIKADTLATADDTNTITAKPNGKESPNENNISTPSLTTSDSDTKSEAGDVPPVTKKKKKKKNGPDRLARRIKHFRKVFASEIADELPTLIDTYVCAYQGDILLQGKMYVTDRYLCFYSRIINYVTKHVYRWEDIDTVTKERVAFIFPTAIGLKVGDPKRKIVYASFLARDDAYTKIKSIWSQHKSNPNSAGDDDSSLGYDPSLVPADKPGYSNDNANSTGLYNSFPTDDMRLDNGAKSTMVASNNGDNAHAKSMTNFPQDGSNKNTLYNRKQKNANENNNDTKKGDRSSRKLKGQQPRNDSTKRSRSGHKAHSRTRSAQRPRDQTSTERGATEGQSVLVNSSAPQNSNSTSNTDTLVNHTTNSSSEAADTDTISTRAINMFLSFVNMFIDNASSWFRYVQTHSTKTTTFVLLLLTVLFFHSIYLIALAYRVENRLHSLHSLWPSSSLKNSLSSKAKQML